jgi:KGK domain
MSDTFEKLEREDVISVYSGQILVNNRTFTINEIITALMPIIKEKSGNTWTEDKEQWFRDGTDCKILKPGAKSWQRGKVRISLEFEPENLEIEELENGNMPTHQLNSPLDDIRQRISKE